MADKLPTAARRWLVTINNPTDKGLTHDAIKDVMAHGQVTDYWCMCDEIGDECETLHTHLYIVFQRPARFSTLRAKFQNSHLDRPNGTSAECRAYVLKDGPKFNKQPDGKYHYVDSKKQEHDGTNYSDTFEEQGELPDEHQGKRTDIDRLFTMIQDGLDNYEILSQSPAYMDKLTAIERTRQILIEKQYREEFRTLEVTYIYGPPRTGKTRSVMDEYGYSGVCRVTDYKHPFDNYRGQDVLLLDEYRNGIKISEILPLLEGYPVELPCRYANKQACFTKVYIVSNEPLEFQYSNIRFDNPDTYKAWLARINRIRVFADDGTHKDYTVQEYMSRPGSVPYNGPWPN